MMPEWSRFRVFDFDELNFLTELGSDSKPYAGKMRSFLELSDSKGGGRFPGREKGGAIGDTLAAIVDRYNLLARGLLVAHEEGNEPKEAGWKTTGCALEFISSGMNLDCQPREFVSETKR